MKKIFFLCVFFTCGVFCLSKAAFAQQIFSLEGNQYKVFIFPKDDAGNYCEKNETKKDTIEFKYGSSFSLQSFKDTVTLDEHAMEWLHDYFGENETLGGSYDQDSGAFDAAYNTFDNNYNYYKFSFDNAKNIFNVVLFGKMTIKYYEPVWESLILFKYITRWDLKDDTEATFICIKD